MVPLIKSKNLYKLVKFVKGINLDEYSTEWRSGKTGISTKNFGKTWFLTPYGKVLFKDYDVASEGIRIINELLYDELAGQIGLSVAKYIPADFKAYPIHYLLRADKDKIEKPDPEKIYHGLASVSVTKENEKLWDGGKLLDYHSSWGDETLTDYSTALDMFENAEGYSVDKEEIIFNLYKMLVLDELTFMEDRHLNNINFIKNDVNNYLISSPVIDNEMCFGGKVLWANKHKIPNNLDLKAFLRLHGLEMRTYATNDIIRVPVENRYRENVKALVGLAQKNERFKEFLTFAVNNLSIESAINNVEKMGYEMSDEYKDFVKYLSRFSKKLFKGYMIEYSKEQDEPKESE